MTQSVALGFIKRRAAVTQARVKSSYAAKLENLSQSSSTASTRESSGRLRSPWSCKLYGGSANTRSTDAAGSFVISATQSPTTIRAERCASTPDWTYASRDSILTRGVLADAPRRDKTMTQNSDSGDASRRRGTYNRRTGLCPAKVKNRLTANRRY